MTSAIAGLDHIALTVADLDDATAFYAKIGGKVTRSYEIDERKMVNQILLGGAMLNLHQSGHSHPLVALRATPGAGDFCFRWSDTIGSAVALLEDAGIPIIDGPVERFASNGLAGTSIYFRDPDGNLVEFLSTLGTS